MHRHLLRTLVPLAAPLFALLAGCSGKHDAANQDKTLHVFIWDDYLADGLVEKFEAANHCKVKLDYFDSNESMLAKIKAGGSGYDIIVPSSYMVKIMADDDMFLPLDHAKLPNLANLDGDLIGAFALDKQMTHSVPYMCAPTCLGYIEGKITGPTDTWAMLDSPGLNKRATLLNDMRETLGAALKSLGYSLNTTNQDEINAARDTVIRWKQHIAKFESDDYDGALASGEFVLVHGYAGDLFQAKEENDKVRIVVPKEGTSIAMDELAIPKDAPQPDLAHAFINFLCDPQVAAENTNYIYYLAPNTKAYPLIDEALRSDPVIMIAPELRTHSEVIQDLGADNAKYIKAWDEVKAAR